jgi:tRNA (mo5U34)-methyltransferase
VTTPELVEAVSGIDWWHRIDLGNGVVTPGRDDSRTRLARMRLPERLDGLSVLDVGAWDGFFSFEAERRGAGRVLATDSHSWAGAGWGSKAGFELARTALGSSVEDADVDVMDLSPGRVGGLWDVVLFLGVLYHLRDPLLALERVASVTGGLLILETHVELGGRRPRMSFYPGRELDDDPTNWWGPNPAAVEAMLREVGFSRVARVFPSRSFALARLPYRAVRALRDRHPALALRQARAVFHASR